MPARLIVHGGAWRIPPEEHADHLQGVEAAARAGWALLMEGASALDVVEKAVMLLEDDPTFDAGTGSVLNCLGEIEMDAIIMDGRTLEMGAVAAVQGIQNPVRLARLVLEDTDHNMLVGQGAHDFARLKGMRFTPAAALTVPREVKRFMAFQAQPPTKSAESFTAAASGGTVGAVALDNSGNIAVATSTGGTAFSLPGRVGDSPLVGSGAYADNETGGASLTGHGEKIMQVVLAKHATDLIRLGKSAQEAADASIAYLYQRVEGYGGLIVVDKFGGLGFAHNTPHMAVAWVDETGALHTYIAPPA